MNGKKILLAAVSATLLAGAAAGVGFAAPGGHDWKGRHGHGRHGWLPPEVIYVRMLKQFDTNGDMKISKDEAKAGVDKIFDEIDTNKDGSITPGELRAYHEARMQAWKADNAKMGDDKTKGPDDQAQNDDKANDGKDGKRPHHRGPHGMREAGMMRSALFFQRVDTDENGQISKAEAEAALDKLFDRMDRNHDGFISLDDMPNFPLL
ncbi:EF-hand domain-containing protein [Rhizobium tubonense]|uniref:Calcium-binding protein n=1 Tax=Rhizobium tubonense TaxID=484088 RepID=A0A2W4EL54_9HYPH|nr:EF-hand domain-containing protein [Rhizobium tubonense]PZM12133.1 calcium-binding protein [Rhizobium tubonense]